MKLLLLIVFALCLSCTSSKVSGPSIRNGIVRYKGNGGVKEEIAVLHSMYPGYEIVGPREIRSGRRLYDQFVLRSATTQMVLYFRKKINTK